MCMSVHHICAVPQGLAEAPDTLELELQTTVSIWVLGIKPDPPGEEPGALSTEPFISPEASAAPFGPLPPNALSFILIPLLVYASLPLHLYMSSHCPH